MRPLAIILAACFALAPLSAKAAPAHPHARATKTKKKTAKGHRPVKRKVKNRRVV